jgi:hypothetical protein
VIVLVAAAALGATARAQAAETWCGKDAVSANRVPDLEVSSAKQVRVMYVLPADATDRFGTLASLLASDVASIDAWWQAQDPARAPRWDRYAFPGCTSRFGGLDIGFVRLPNGGDAYLPDRNGLTRLDDAMAAFASSDSTKTLVFYDGPIANQNLCGGTNYRSDTAGGRVGFTYVFLQSGCLPDPGTGGITARTAVHELTHNLGAVLDAAPHACPDKSGHVCDSAGDLMYPAIYIGWGLGSASLDIGHDDYYGHSGSWWDVQDSAWLMHLPQLPLAVTVQGTGTVTVTTDAPVDCSRGCTLSLDTGLQVQLARGVRPGWRFVGWSGACTGAAACTVTMDGPKSVRALFARQLETVRVTVAGSGRVISSPQGISCPGRCTGPFASGTTVRLVARPATGMRFAGWSGACHGTGACSIRADGPRSVRATFRRR